jgi:hypothetical protein
MFEFLKIIALSITAAIAYGIVHDQITARICVEYFTIGHPPVFETDSPTLLGLGWGVIATWWAGAMIGVPFAIAARAGRSRPQKCWRDLVKPVIALLASMAVIAAMSGVVAYLLARSGKIWLLEPQASQIAVDRHALFLADGGTHLASYTAGFIGGLILSIWTWRNRRTQIYNHPV